MQYNTQQEHLPLPEYGRGIQNMVNHAMTIEDRAERQRCANTIIKIMGNMFPLMRDLPDFKHKLWDHLAIMSDFRLDIDYPYDDIVKPESLAHVPEAISYPTGGIRYRHYGRVLEQLLKKAAEMQEGEEKSQLLHLIGIQMRKNFVSWNKDTVELDKIIADVAEYTNGTVRLTCADLEFTDVNLAPTTSRRPVMAQQRRRAAKKK